jgi:hypothetical protein
MYILTSPAKLRPEEDCAVDAQQQLNITDPTSRQRVSPSTNPQLFTNNLRKKGGKLVASLR